MHVNTPHALARLEVLFAFARIIAGAAVLGLLGAPVWAIAAFVMLNIRVKLVYLRDRTFRQ